MWFTHEGYIGCRYFWNYGNQSNGGLSPTDTVGCNSSVPRGRWSSLIGFRDFEYVPRKNSLDIARDFSNFSPHFSPPPPPFLSALFSLSFEKSNLLPSVNYLRARTMLEIVGLMRRFICFSLSLSLSFQRRFIGKYCWKVSRVNSALIFFENCATRMQSVFRCVYRRGSGSCFYKKAVEKEELFPEILLFLLSLLCLLIMQSKFNRISNSIFRN